jgi:hypothetical protein
MGHKNNLLPFRFPIHYTAKICSTSFPPSWIQYGPLVPRHGVSAATDVTGSPATNAQARKYKDDYLATASAVLAASQGLCSTFVQKQHRRFIDGEEEGLMLLFSLQADEATKTMRVENDTQYEQVLQQQQDRNNAKPVGKRKHLPSHTIVAKVQYSELAVSSVIRDKNGKIVVTTWGLPLNLQHFDKCDAENLRASQETIMDLPCFDNHVFSRYKHVGVAACQDASGANEKQVSALLLDDSIAKNFGGKRRFRISTRCCVHAWQRCITLALGYCRTMISGLIALSITQRQAGKLEALRQIIGKQLELMLVIMRTIFTKPLI